MFICRYTNEQLLQFLTIPVGVVELAGLYQQSHVGIFKPTDESMVYIQAPTEVTLTFRGHHNIFVLNKQFLQRALSPSLFQSSRLQLHLQFIDCHRGDVCFRQLYKLDGIDLRQHMQLYFMSDMQLYFI